MIRAHAFVGDLERPELSREDRHHFERVLRLQPGDLVSVCDGAGGLRPCRFGPVLEPAGAVEHVPRPAPSVAVGFSLTKGDRSEWVVQKLTEAGVDRIVPLTAARSVVRWDEAKAARNLARLQRVAREAAMQSRRAWLPAVDPVSPFRALAAEPGAALADREGSPPTLDHPMLLVGPEGGWDEAERDAGPPRVTFGPHVLRAETAALAAGLLLCALRAGVVGAAVR